MENIIKTPGSTLIFNGGNPLPGCPENWDQAKKIIEAFNLGKDEYGEPNWDFDCGFKLDFDGPLIRISSRFYPPKSHYGATWDGAVSIWLMEDVIASKSFDCETIEELRTQVEAFVTETRNKILTLLKDKL